MNSFLKGFFSLFDWMSPKTLEEQFEDLDNSMQKLLKENNLKYLIQSIIFTSIIIS